MVCWEIRKAPFLGAFGVRQCFVRFKSKTKQESGSNNIHANVKPSGAERFFIAALT
jgi:hypothetical protein